MKLLETNFVEYIKKNKLHNNLYSLKNNKFINSNLIIYGPEGVGKYTIALDIIKNYSPSKLKYERKINFKYNKKYEFMFKISDIHFEIDMELLGCKSNTLWNDIYNRIIDIISTKKEMTGIILCKNFNKINNDLLNKFYSYMQCLRYKNINLVYILITTSVGFLPESIINQCNILSVPKPKKEKYEKVLNLDLKEVDTDEITNIKGIITNNILNENKLSLEINEYIYNKDEFKYDILREKIYKLLVFNLDIHSCIWNIFNNILENYKLNEKEISYLLDNIVLFSKFYNNNYRPIYHLEKIILEFYRIIHKI